MVSNAGFVFPQHRSLDVEEAHKVLMLQSNYSRTSSWLKPFHPELVAACLEYEDYPGHSFIVTLNDRDFILAPIKGNPDLWRINPADIGFVPMSVFSLSRIQKEMRDDAIEIS
jgi:hypothetical protein